MKSSILILLILFMLGSCGLCRRSQGFSKRKHLKGHFWNFKGRFKKNQGDDKTIAFNIQEINTSEPELTTANSKEIAKSISENNVSSKDGPILRPPSEQVLETDQPLETLNEKDSHIHEKDENEQNYQTPPRKPGQKDGLGALIITWSILFYGGLLLLATYFIIAAVHVAYNWLLITSLIMIGIPLGLLIIAVTIVLIVSAIN